MSYFEDNIFPGEQGMVFKINTKDSQDIAQVKALLSDLPQIKSLEFDEAVYPHEMRVITSETLNVKDLQNKLIPHRFHALPKTYSKL
jgi:hypothetical protein